jgi:hypothetical protein
MFSRDTARYQRDDYHDAADTTDCEQRQAGQVAAVTGW